MLSLRHDNKSHLPIRLHNLAWKVLWNKNLICSYMHRRIMLYEMINLLVFFFAYLAFNATIPFEQEVSWKKTLFPKFGFFVACITSGNNWILYSAIFIWFEKHLLAIRSLLSDHKLIVTTMATIVIVTNTLNMKCCFMNTDAMYRTICKIWIQIERN